MRSSLLQQDIGLTTRGGGLFVASLQQSITPAVLLTREHGAAGGEADHLREGMAPRCLLQGSMTGAMAGHESGKGTDFEDDILHVGLRRRGISTSK